ncbi:MAG: NUDIX hydrolase [Planctomycetota bacterium]
MTPKPWPETRRARLAQYYVFDVQIAHRVSPRTGREMGFFIIDTLDWVNVIAETTAGEIVLVHQFRHGPATATIEIPGGAIELGENPAVAAARELREETGYASSSSPIYLGSVNPNPALFTNRCHSYLIRGCERVGDPDPDAGEDFEVLTLPLTELESRVLRGEIDHALVLNALYFLRLGGGR